MVSPNLIKKSQSFFTVNPETKKLFQLAYGQQQKTSKGLEDDDIPRIHVSQIVSRLSFIYEKIRIAVDYDEDHLLRKNAIKRILKRQIMIEGALKNYDSEEVSKHLLTELIQAGYLENNKIPEAKIGEVGILLDKYIKLRHYFKENYPAHNLGNKESKERNKLVNWIISLAATEIEENLNSTPLRQAVIANMFSVLSRIIKLPPDLSYQKDLDLQIYLSISRSYLKLDLEMQSFLAFKFYNSWEEAQEEDLIKIAKNLKSLNQIVERQLHHPLMKQIDKIVRRYSLYYSMLLETMSDNAAKVYDNATTNEKAFFSLIKEKCQKRYSKVKNKLWRSGLRSIIYIFLTKSIFVFILEIPAIKFFGEQVNTFSLAINVSFPAVLLFLMILFTKTPNAKNTEKIINGIKEITYSELKKTQPIYLRRPTRRNYLMNSLFNLIYAGAFLISVYFLIKLLNYINFNWVSITIFLFFLAFVSFFSFRVKRDVKQYVITDDKETILGFIFDFFYMPIVAMGKFLSDNVSRLNFFIFIFDFILEAPFKIIISIVEDWTKYLKEKKENLA